MRTLLVLIVIIVGCFGAGVYLASENANPLWAIPAGILITIVAVAIGSLGNNPDF